MITSRAFAILIVVAALAAIGWAALNNGSATGPAERSAPPTTDRPEPIPILGPADTLTNLDGWLNTKATSLEELQAENEIVVVQFWTFGCRNCKNTLVALGELYDRFAEKGLEIVGVHAPEFSHEAEVDNIIEAADRLGVTWPIALDTDKANFHRWQEGPISYWPRVYLIDSHGQIRYDKRGDGAANYERLAEYVERLLSEDG